MAAVNLLQQQLNPVLERVAALEARAADEDMADSDVEFASVHASEGRRKSSNLATVLKRNSNLVHGNPRILQQFFCEKTIWGLRDLLRPVRGYP